jgi:hypothetical protein
MNLLAMVARCKSRFKDTGALSVTDQEWKDYLNDAYMDVVSERPDWPFNEVRSTTTSVTSGTGTVALPEDAWRVSAVYNSTDGFPLEPIDGPTLYRHLFPNPGASLGVPQYYRLQNRNLEVFPWAAVTTTLHVDVHTPPAALADADQPVFPEQYHRSLVQGALQAAYEDRGNLQQSSVHKASRDAIVRAMALDLLGQPRTEHYPEVQDTF